MFFAAMLYGRTARASGYPKHAVNPNTLANAVVMAIKIFHHKFFLLHPPGIGIVHVGAVVDMTSCFVNSLIIF